MQTVTQPVAYAHNSQTAIQPTPVAYAQKRLSPRMGALHGMEVALGYGNDAVENQRKQFLGVCDVSCFSRFGVKGLNAVQWLAARKLEIPAERNTWLLQESGALVLRLGNSEFLVEDQFQSDVCKALRADDQQKIHGLYRVQRSDAALLLSGSAVQNLLSELCTLDLRGKALAENAVVMTQVAGISATILRQTVNGEAIYRLWCDGTYGPYMWDTLLEIAEELGGGAVGLSAHFKDVL